MNRTLKQYNWLLHSSLLSSKCVELPSDVALLHVIASFVVLCDWGCPAYLVELDMTR